MPDLRTDPGELLRSIDPTSITEDCDRLGLDAWSDAQLAHAAGTVLSTPRSEPADSFVLHAPLELLGRLGLLRHVDASRRRDARHRIVGLAVAFARWGDGLTEPEQEVDDLPPRAAAARLDAAVRAGDLDEVDRTATALLRQVGPAVLGPLLIDAVLPRLSAAAHLPIGLHLLPRVAASGEVPLTVLRGTLRELARYPSARLEWPSHLPPSEGPDRSVSLGAALAATPRIEPPASDFVWPTMAAAEASGVVETTLAEPLRGPVDLAIAPRQVLRVAAHSMLQDDPDAAPYGWSHALTMPQGVLSQARFAADPRVAVATAATYLVGFRATLGQRPIDLAHEPEPVDLTLAQAIPEGPQVAAAAAWHHHPEERPAVMAELASWASLREDAHLVKYVQACFDAAAADPTQVRLYLAAAAHLTGWWAQRVA